MNCMFRRQFPIGRYIVDFVRRKHNLVIEIDGGHHTEQQEYDAIRTEWLQSQGFEVLRYWDNDVLTQLDSIASVLERRGHRIHPHPNPLPEGEGACWLVLMPVCYIPLSVPSGS